MIDTYLAATGIALPDPVPTPRFLAVTDAMRRRHGQRREVREQAKRFVDGSRIQMRHSVHPAWQPEEQRNPDVEDIFTPADFDPPMWQRARAWAEHAPRLAVQAAREAVARWGRDPREITHVVTTSTTGWEEPGVAVALMEALELGEDTRKIELNFNGCFCGASCLRTARDIVRGGESGAVLVVAAEVSSTQINIVDSDPSTLIANALFSDGAAAVILQPEPGPWRFERAGMSVIPGTRELLRWNPDFEKVNTTPKMYLDHRVSEMLAGYFRDHRGARYLDALLESGEPAPALAIHPGGPGILEALEQVVVERGWSREHMAASFDTLYHTGNLGAAAMLFVLHNLLERTRDERVASFAFGPGVTVEWGTWRRAEGR